MYLCSAKAIGVWCSWLAFLHGVQAVARSSRATPTNYLMFIKNNGTGGIYIDTNGHVRIGSGTGLISKTLEVNGTIRSKEVIVELANWSDFVFDNNYNLMSLKETERFIKQYGHLPNVPSAAEVEKEGIELGEMNAILLQKIEELTLYVIELQKQIDELKGDKR